MSRISDAAGSAHTHHGEIRDAVDAVDTVTSAAATLMKAEQVRVISTVAI